jgi:D-methionine transport system ATP-binding protein
MTLIAENGEPDLADVLAYLASLDLHGEVLGHVV